jgi:nucleotide-binding universal stress UspA family protein
VPCTTELLIGYPPSQIAALADELDVDLIVVGSRHLELDRLYKVAVGCPVRKPLEGGAELTEIIEARPAAA